MSCLEMPSTSRQPLESSPEWFVWALFAQSRVPWVKPFLCYHHNWALCSTFGPTLSEAKEEGHVINIRLGDHVVKEETLLRNNNNTNEASQWRHDSNKQTGTVWRNKIWCFLKERKLQSSTKVLAHFTVLTKNEHCISLPVPTPNTMLISIPATMRQYSNIVWGRGGLGKLSSIFPNGRYLPLGAFLVKCAKGFCRGL